jgi:parallel beta-helix repeat protein
VGSLRAAIALINAGDEVLDFELASTDTINVTTALPEITDRVNIDGTNQLGDGRIQILWTGGSSVADGLVFAAGSAGSTIDGLMVGNFTGYGLKLLSNDNFVTNTYIGLLADGTTAAPNLAGGILIQGAKGNTIGGDLAGQGNLISANGSGSSGAGIEIFGSGIDEHELVARMDSISDDPLGELVNSATGNQVLGNIIGTNLAGANRGNVGPGVWIHDASQNTVRNNTIGFNGTGITVEASAGEDTGTAIDNRYPLDSFLSPLEKITIRSKALGNVVQSNYIGILPGESTIDIGNDGDGVLVDGASKTRIGGDAPGAGNTISYNSGNGVRITGEVTSLTQDDYPPPSSASFASNQSVTDSEEDSSQPVIGYVGRVNIGAIGPFAAGLANLFGSETTALARRAGFTVDDPARGTVVTSAGRVPTRNLIQGNFIGTLPGGQATYSLSHVPQQGNTLDGVRIETAARLTVVGADLGSPLGEGGPLASNSRNVIGASGGSGIHIIGDPLNDRILEPTTLSKYYGDHRETTDFFSLGDPVGGLSQTFQNNFTINDVVPTIVQGNYIGIFQDGSGDPILLGNGVDGIEIDDSRAFVFRNVISANDESGVHITGTPTFAAIFGEEATATLVDSLVMGNFIGTAPDGSYDEAAGNGDHGVFLDEGAQYNFIGALPVDTSNQSREVAASQGNVISGNDDWGIFVHGMGAYHWEGPDAQDYFDPFLYPKTAEGHNLEQPYGTVVNSIMANFIGVDRTGNAEAPNGAGGVLVDNAAAFTGIGSIFADVEDQWYGNVISANDGPGVVITGKNTTVTESVGRGTAVNVLGGNFIGLGADGQKELGNQEAGIVIRDGAVATNIGGDVFNTSLGSRNYIAANFGPGILVKDAYDLVRAEQEGEVAGDPKTGVNLDAGMGGLGNHYFTNAIDSNWIGIGVNREVYGAGLINLTPVPIGNHGDGILIDNSSNTLIGGFHSSWTRNIISANQGNGIHITGDKSFFNTIQQVFVGVDPNGEYSEEGAYANTGDGILIDNGAHHNAISGAGISLGFFKTILEPLVAGVNAGPGTFADEALSTFPDRWRRLECYLGWQLHRDVATRTLRSRQCR